MRNLKVTIEQKSGEVNSVMIPNLSTGEVFTLVKEMPLLFEVGLWLKNKYIKPEDINSISME